MATIFITDDSSTTRASVEYTLQQAGFNVVACESGPACLQKVENESNTISLFINDVNMPEMDGITLIKHLREIEKIKFTPILMLTTESEEEKKQQGKKAGASGWLVKPFNPEQLVDIVKRFVK